MDRFQVYKDIEARTNGEIYIGVEGPVRTGKSTFFKRFMDVLVLPEGADNLDLSKPIGCSSQRRILQLQQLYPEATFKSNRGNVLTR